MCDYSKFWDELKSLPQVNIVDELVRLFDKYGLLDNEGKPMETPHFELKAWKNDYLQDSGRKGLTEHVTAIANTVIKKPLEKGILVVGIYGDIPLNQIPYVGHTKINGREIDKLKVLKSDLDLESGFVNKLKNYLRENTIPQFPVEEIKHWILKIPRDDKIYPLVFLKIPIKVGQFYGIKAGSNNFIYCMAIKTRETSIDKSPKSEMHSLFYILRDIHKGTVFDVLSGFGYLREPQFEIEDESLKILNQRLPLDLIELDALIGQETERLKKSYMDYLVEKRLVQKNIGDKWSISLSAILLFGLREVKIQNFDLPEIEIGVNVEREEDIEVEEVNLTSDKKNISPQSFPLVPIRKSLKETVSFLNNVMDLVEEVYYEWPEIIPAFYEVFLNAILHMNYLSKNPKIRITLFENHIRVENPCLWNLKGLSIEQLTSTNFPKPNKFFYEFFKEMNFLDDLKDDIFEFNNITLIHGLKNLVVYMLQHGFPLPTFYFTLGSFVIDLPARKDIELERFYTEVFNYILSSQEIRLQGRRIKNIDMLKPPDLVALHICLFEQPKNLQRRFNEFFDGDVKIYERFVESVREEYQKISGGE